jgi:(2Fe-2S) ferredoxin
MPPFTHSIFICSNQRPGNHPRGCCDPIGHDQLRETFKQEVKKRKLGPLVRANKTGCLEQCELGPVVAIYPQGIFYGHVTPDDVPRILEQTIQNNIILEDLLIHDDEMNNPTCDRAVARRAEIQTRIAQEQQSQQQQAQQQ